MNLTSKNVSLVSYGVEIGPQVGHGTNSVACCRRNSTTALAITSGLLRRLSKCCTTIGLRVSVRYFSPVSVLCMVHGHQIQFASIWNTSPYSYWREGWRCLGTKWRLSPYSHWREGWRCLGAKWRLSPYSYWRAGWRCLGAKWRLSCFQTRIRRSIASYIHQILGFFSSYSIPVPHQTFTDMSICRMLTKTSTSTIFRSLETMFKRKVVCWYSTGS